MLLALLLLAAAGPTEDAAVGKWKFDPSISTYESGPAPQTSERVWEVVDDKIHFLHTGTSADGKPFRTEFTAGYDGQDYPVQGGSLYDTVSLTMTHPHVVEQVFKKAGKVTVQARRTVSQDKKRMTIVATGTNAQGKAFKNILVYARE